MTIIANASDLGHAVRAERKRQGFTQAELADYAGVGITFVSNLENGKETAELGKALRVAQTLGIDLHAKRRES